MLDAKPESHFNEEVTDNPPHIEVSEAHRNTSRYRTPAANRGSRHSNKDAQDDSSASVSRKTKASAEARGRSSGRQQQSSADRSSAKSESAPCNRAGHTEASAHKKKREKRSSQPSSASSQRSSLSIDNPMEITNEPERCSRGGDSNGQSPPPAPNWSSTRPASNSSPATSAAPVQGPPPSFSKQALEQTPRAQSPSVLSASNGTPPDQEAVEPDSGIRRRATEPLGPQELPENKSIRTLIRKDPVEPAPQLPCQRMLDEQQASLDSCEAASPHPSGLRTSMVAYSIVHRDGNSLSWIRCGVGRLNPDGSVNVRLDALPLSGELHLRPIGKRHPPIPHSTAEAETAQKMQVLERAKAQPA